MEEEMEQQLTITAGELMDSTYLSRSGIIKDFLPPGTYILAGQPKIGKSFFVTQLCWCVAEGQPFLGFETEPGTVLYLPLEDTEARLQSRMGKMFGTEWVGKRLHLMFHPKSKEGAAKDLAAFLKDHPETRVVVIDTLQRVRTDDGSVCSYANDYRTIVPFKSLSDQYRIALILVHHTRKNTEDPNTFNFISGTNGILGAADGAFVLYNQKGNILMDFTGRDLPRTQYQLRFDKNTCLWELLGMGEPPEPKPPEPLLDIIDAAIDEKWFGTPADFAAMVNEEAKKQGINLRKDGDPDKELQPNALTRQINLLAERLEEEKGVTFQGMTRSAQRIIAFVRMHPSGNAFDGIVDIDGIPPAVKNTDETVDTVEKEDVEDE